MIDNNPFLEFYYMILTGIIISGLTLIIILINQKKERIVILLIALFLLIQILSFRGSDLFENFMNWLPNAGVKFYFVILTTIGLLIVLLKEGRSSINNIGLIGKINLFITCTLIVVIVVARGSVLNVLEVIIYLQISFNAIHYLLSRKKGKISNSVKFKDFLVEVLAITIALQLIIFSVQLWVGASIQKIIILSSGLSIIIIKGLYTMASKNRDTYHAKMQTSKRYLDSNLHPLIAKEYKKILNEFINRQGFKNAHINLPKLSKDLEIPKNYLSQIINEHYNLNFFDFLNYYRIREAKKLLKNGYQKKSTIREVSIEVGFESKSTFNQSFKKFTGMTPSEFIKKEARDF